MRTRSIVFAALALAVFSSSAQAAYIAFGNHEGGLIPSSSDFRSREFRSDVVQTATEHCARYNKVAYITGAVPGYGNYVSFTCAYDRQYDPVKAGASLFWSRH
jgi:hypothetical protein